MFSAFNPSKCAHLEQWAADAVAPREQLGIRCLAQGSHLSRGQSLPEPRFEPTTLGYKSNALSIRATTAPEWRMGRLVRNDRKTTVTQITTRYNQGVQNTISEHTTHRTLKQMDSSSRRPHRVPLLSDKNSTRRI